MEDPSATYAVVNKKVKAKKKALQKPDPGMEMYAVVDKSKKSKSSEKLVGPSSFVEDEAPTYDMIDSGFNKAPVTGASEPADTYSRIDRSAIPSKTPPVPAPAPAVVPAIPAKKESDKKDEDSMKKDFSKITLASIILFVILGIILFALIIALIVAFVKIVQLQGMLNTLKTDSSSSAGTEAAIGTTSSPVNESELEANYTMLMESFEMLKMTINTLIANVTNETTSEINMRREDLDMLMSMLDGVRRSVEVEIPGNLTAIESNANMTLSEISQNVTDTLSNLQQNFTARIEGINTYTNERLQLIRQVANQTILMGQLTAD